MCQHFQLGHQSLLLHRVMFFCSVKMSHWLLFTSNCCSVKNVAPQTFEHLHCHLLWHSGLADTISRRLDHHSKSPRAQFLTWITQIDALMTTSSSADYNAEFYICTQFQVLPGKLPLGVVLEVLEIYVDVIVVIWADHLDHLKLRLILGFLWKTPKSSASLCVCMNRSTCVIWSHSPSS